MLKKILIGVAVVFVGLMVLGMIIGDDTKTASVESTASNEPVKAVAPETKQPKEEVITVGVEELCTSYEKNEVAADKKFKGKLIKITGKVDDIKKDLLDNLYVTLRRQKDFEMCRPQCFFEDEYEDQLANLNKGQTVTIIGRVDGLLGTVSVKEAQLVN